MLWNRSGDLADILAVQDPVPSEVERLFHGIGVLDGEKWLIPVIPDDPLLREYSR